MKLCANIRSSSINSQAGWDLKGEQPASSYTWCPRVLLRTPTPPENPSPAGTIPPNVPTEPRAKPLLIMEASWKSVSFEGQDRAGDMVGVRLSRGQQGQRAARHVGSSPTDRQQAARPMAAGPLTADIGPLPVSGTHSALGQQTPRRPV